MSTCATMRAVLCGGRPVQPFPLCEFGEVQHIGPVAMKPRCYSTAEALSVEMARRREFLAFVHPLRRHLDLDWHLEPDELGL